MESNIFVDTIKQSFRTAVGATAYLVETLQDDQKRNELLSELNTKWAEKSQEWQEKGALTEQEARRIIENFFQQQANQGQTQQSYSYTRSNNDDSYSQDIRDLTQEIISLRNELKKD